MKVDSFGLFLVRPPCSAPICINLNLDSQIYFSKSWIRDPQRACWSKKKSESRNMTQKWRFTRQMPGRSCYFWLLLGTLDSCRQSKTISYTLTSPSSKKLCWSCLPRAASSAATSAKCQQRRLCKNLKRLTEVLLRRGFPRKIAVECEERIRRASARRAEGNKGSTKAMTFCLWWWWWLLLLL